MKIVHNLALACVLVMLSIVPVLAANHALLIGVSDYGGSGFHNLDGTLNDISLVRGMLKNRFGFKDAEITVLTNAQATHAGIKNAFAALAKQVGKDDFVYIQYSGHGSYTLDQNGDEKTPHADGKTYDSTWVSYGARGKQSAAAPGERGGIQDNNGFDILDDEIAAWMDPIYRKTSNVAFISDSCHSGSMTRGSDAPKVRAIAVDLRPHPLGKQPVKEWKQAGVQIGAARDDQQAGEYVAADGKSYGLFTWHWVQAIYQASPGDTWNDLYKRTTALIGTYRANLQHPQISGEKNRSAFTGQLKAPSPTIPISKVSDDGKQVTLKAGRFLGITQGSVFRSATRDATITIATVSSFDSQAEVTKGSFKTGDLVIEETHVYPYEPTKLFLRADLPQDTALVNELRANLAKLPGYTLATSQKEADLLLMVLRPKRANGQPVKERPEATLPMADPAVKPEIWLLTSNEQPTRENLQLKPDSNQRAVVLATEALNKMARIRDIKRMGTTATAGTQLVDLQITRYTLDKTCTGQLPACWQIDEGQLKGTYRKVGTFQPNQLQSEGIKRGDLLTFKVKNTSPVDLYIYLLDITPDGKIEPFLPFPDNPPEDGLVKAGTERDFMDYTALLVEKEGEDTIKLLASQMMIDVALFKQEAFKTRGATKGANNPLEAFLLSVTSNRTRGTYPPSGGRAKWGTVQFSFEGK